MSGLIKIIIENKMVVKAMCIVFLIIFGCRKQNTGLEDTEIITAPFYVFVDEQNPYSTMEECGYLLFADLGSQNLFHDRFFWAENLPKKYQEYLLPVIVTYRIEKGGNHVTNEGNVQTYCTYPIIHIIKIKKNKK